MDSKEKKEVSFKGVFKEEDSIQWERHVYTKDLWKDIDGYEDWKKNVG